jgi:Cu-Zn family superoxide dismutase
MRPVALVLFFAGLSVTTLSAQQGRDARMQHAFAVLRDAAGATVGRATFSQGSSSDSVTADISVAGLTPGPHGLHVHAVGSCEAAGTSAFGAAGGHFNPSGRSHGLRNPQGPHAGDLPDLEVGGDGSGRLRVTTGRLSLTAGPSSLLDQDGSALVIHAGPDDQVSDPAGNSGGRVACGVITTR